MQQGYLIVDIGTGNMRVIIADTKGQLVGMATCDCSYQREPAYRDSTVFSPSDWMADLRQLMRRALAQSGPIQLLAVSSTSQREGIVLLDAAGQAFLGLPNIDQRAADDLDRLQGDGQIERLTGFAPGAAFSGPKLYATMLHQPDVARRIVKVTSISEWVGYEFTGQLAWEHSQAMHNLTYDLDSRTWSSQLCALLGFPMDWLPELIQSGTALGTLRGEYRQLLGCGEIPFVIGGADTQMAMTGMQLKPGDVGMISGTTTPVEMLLDHRPAHKGGWLNPHSEAGQFMLEVNAAYTGINYQRLKNLLFSQKTYEELEQEALQRGLPRCMAMFAMGLNEPEGPVTKGGWLFDNPLPYDLHACDLMHAMALDIACGVRMATDLLARITDDLPETFMGCGGGLQGLLLPGYVAALCGRPLIVYEGYMQASALGCVRMCERLLGRPPFVRKVLRRVPATPVDGLEAYYRRWRVFRESLRSVNELRLEAVEP